MTDPRLLIVLAIYSEPDMPLKYYISKFAKSRGTFFRAKADLMVTGILKELRGRRGYVVLNIDKANAFIRENYPGLEIILDHKGAKQRRLGEGTAIQLQG